LKRITNFSDSVFRIKVYTPNFKNAKFEKKKKKKKNYKKKKKKKKDWKKQDQELKCHIVDVPNGIIWFLFSIQNKIEYQ